MNNLELTDTGAVLIQFADALEDAAKEKNPDGA